MGKSDGKRGARGAVHHRSLPKRLRGFVQADTKAARGSDVFDTVVVILTRVLLGADAGTAAWCEAAAARR